METLALVEWEALMMQLLQGLMNWQKLLSLILLQISKDKFIELNHFFLNPFSSSELNKDFYLKADQKSSFL